MNNLKVKQEQNQIHLLDEATINKIAAGEVVERPASVVKELIENSLDSGATSVRVDIGSDSGGIFRIRVFDDGSGMDRESAILSLKRHATSKINNVSDLLQIHTMGFRGEALASIAGVSKLTLITKVHLPDVISGTKIVVEGGNILDISDAGSPDGTSVLVENLFFNTPARKKFLKSRQTEFNHIYNVIEQTAIANRDVSFQLVHNGKEKLSTIKSGSLTETIAYLYGREVVENLVPLKSATSFMKVEGLCSLQSLSYSNSKQILISINNRPVSSPMILKAVKSGYGTLLPKDRYPAAFINLTIDKNIVDVNVHPAKREVRMSRENEIFKEISSAVKEALESGNLINSGSLNNSKSADNKKTSQYTFNDSAKPLFCADSETVSYKKDNLATNPAIESKSEYHLRFTATDNQLRLTENFDENEHEVKLPEMEVLGQFDSAYIIAEIKNQNSEELVIIDQHAAHERILYDQVLKVRDSGKKAQELLVPAILTLKTRESEILSESLPMIADEGFLIEEFGKNTFAVRSVPLVLGKRIGTEILNDILTDLMDDNLKTLEAKKEKITTTIACRAAIKAGSKLTDEQMKRLINQLSRTKTPYTCPHGRPTMIVFSRSKLDSMFLRS